jgi:hypothetical protein
MNFVYNGHQWIFCHAIYFRSSFTTLQGTQFTGLAGDRGGQSSEWLLPIVEQLGSCLFNRNQEMEEEEERRRA